jgi:hypothetical protein
MAERKHIKTKISKLKKGNFFVRRVAKSEPIYRFLGKQRYYDDNGSFMGWAWVAIDVIDANKVYTRHDVDVVKV